MELPIKVAGKSLKVNIETRGDKGPALLMVHGIPTNARLWRKVQGYLEDRYRTFAMDMMGYGQSDMPLDAFEHSLSNQAEVIKEVILGLGLKGDSQDRKSGKSSCNPRIPWITRMPGRS